jgi:ABC-type bacteriocin/lantibiotic exporter with double-glycine peptidase domain
MKTWFTYLKQGLSRELPEDRISGNHDFTGFKDNLRNLRPYIIRYWRRGLIGFLIIVAGSLCAFPPPLITRYIVDEIIINGRLGLLFGAIILLAGCLVIEKLCRVLEEFYFARMEQQVTLDIQCDLIDRVLHFPKSLFDDNQTGYLQSRLTEDVDGLRWFFSGTAVHIISNTLRFLGGIVLLFYLEWRLSIAVLILWPGLFQCFRFFSSRIHILSHQSMEQKAGASGRLQESLSEAALIKAYSSEKITERRLVSSLKKVMQISLEQTTINSLANLVVHAMPGVGRVIVLAVGAVWIVNGQWSIGSLLAFQAYLAYVFGPVQFLASSNFQLQKALASLKRVSVIFGIVPEANIGVGKKVAKLKGEIKFDNVSFGYHRLTPVLKNFNLHIYPGERVAIVGPSGAGKTTLLCLILRFYLPIFGEIFFDGKPASNFDLSSLRRRVGYVSQQPRLLTGTIIENLRYGNFLADNGEVFRATKAAGIHNFITSLPEGYETKIGEKGFNLSEGQKQRISIARALIKDPDILVLDEPAAALDSALEKSIFDALPSLFKDKTFIVATHHLSAIQDADRVIVLKNNWNVSVRAPSDLLRSNKFYPKSVDTLQEIL